MKNARDTAGKFAVKSDTPRKVRSVNLTDAAWEWLARTAEQAGMSRNDYLEAMAESDTPVKVSVKPQSPENLIDAQVRELRAEVRTLHQDLQRSQKALEKVSNKLAHLADVVNVVD